MYSSIGQNIKSLAVSVVRCPVSNVRCPMSNALLCVRARPLTVAILTDFDELWHRHLELLKKKLARRGVVRVT